MFSAFEFVPIGVRLSDAVVVVAVVMVVVIVVVVVVAVADGGVLGIVCAHLLISVTPH